MRDSKDLLETGLDALALDLKRIKDLTLSEELGYQDAATLVNYIKTLIMYQKDLRQEAKDLDLSNMTDEQLQDEINKITREVKSGKSDTN